MPQFDFYSFSGQIFWTLLGFYFFYFFILHVYLTSFSELFKIRQKLLVLFTKKNTLSSEKFTVFDIFFSNKLVG